MATEEAPAPARRRGGRRPAALVRAKVLRAAADLLFVDGIRAVTFDRVATAAGASRMTLYKWWPSPGALAAEAYFTHSEQTLRFPDTGDIAADLRTQLRSFVRLMTTTNAGAAVVGLIGAAQSDPALRAAFSTGYTRPRRALAMQALERARDRGQLRADLDLTVLIDQLWGACYNRLLQPDEVLDEAFADTLVDVVVRGAAPPGPERR